MRDYRISLAVAVPAACALLAVLWILRKKSGGPGGKAPSKSKGSEKDHNVAKAGQTSEAVASSCTIGVEKEGITITQRKIPETQARDRGDADLVRAAPDFVAGTGHDSRHASADAELNEEEITSTDNDTTGTGLTQVQIEQVEKLIMSAMGDGLHEAKGKLLSSQGQGLALSAEPDLEQSVSPSVSSGIEVSESFEQSHHETLATSLGSLPPEKVISCSLVATTIGFDIEEGKVEQAQCWDSTTKGAILSETAHRPVSTPCLEELKPEACSETAAVGVTPSSPLEQATHFASTDAQGTCVSSVIQEESHAATVKSLSSSEQSTDADSMDTRQQASYQNSPHSNNSSSNVSPSKVSASQILPQKDLQKPQEMSSAGQEKSVVFTSDASPPPSATKRRPPTLSSGSIESQASLGPEDIDSLWGIKPSSGASANWNKQLSLDDPDSPLRKTAVVSEASASCSTSSSSLSLPVPAETVIAPQSKEPLPAPVTDTLVAGEGSTLVAGEGSALTSLPSKTDTNTGVSKDIEPPKTSNSPLCDNNSEGSNDSGRGGSEHEVAQGGNGDSLIQFDFNMPADMCGRFIGRHGKNINFFKSKTGASISLTNNPFSAEFQICQVAGTQAEVDSALAMIRRKFPLQDFPLLTMVPININPNAMAAGGEQQTFIVPDVMQLSLPEGVSVEVYVSAIVDAGHVFVQQPTHRSFMSLEKLTYHLNAVYGQDPNVPTVPLPVECGVICVVEADGFWYRAMIMSQEDENAEAQIKYVDYGGYATMPVSAMKQIRTDFMTLPFQAVECLMANISPLQGEEYFSEEASNALSELTSMKLLQCQVVARSETGAPYIHLYQINPTLNNAELVNRTLCNSRHVQWVEIL